MQKALEVATDLKIYIHLTCGSCAKKADEGIDYRIPAANVLMIYHALFCAGSLSGGGRVGRYRVLLLYARFAP